MQRVCLIPLALLVLYRFLWILRVHFSPSSPLAVEKGKRKTLHSGTQLSLGSQLLLLALVLLCYVPFFHFNWKAMCQNWTKEKGAKRKKKTVWVVCMVKFSKTFESVATCSSLYLRDLSFLLDTNGKVKSVTTGETSPFQVTCSPINCQASS